MRVTESQLATAVELIGDLKGIYWPWEVTGELRLTSKDGDYLGSIWPDGDEWIYGTTD